MAVNNVNMKPLKKKVKILLVDDTPANLVALEAALSPLDEELVFAYSGTEALRHLLHNDFAAILLDVKMPEMDGFETAELIRTRSRSRSTPILFLTAYKGDEHLFRGYDLGAVDFLFKPILPEVLRSKVAVFVELARKADELAELNSSLEKRVIERTRQLMESNQEVRRAKEELELRVAERTAELQKANEQLNRSNEDLRRIEEQLRHLNQRLRALSARLQFAREEEGTRIAREIHDELGSSLTSLKWDLEALDKALSEAHSQLRFPACREKISAMMKVTDITINSVRRIASELRPSILDDLGLVEAVEWQVNHFQNRTGIVCNYRSSLQRARLNRDQSTAAFRILQEALTNILRHAQATKAEIVMEETAGEFVLMITDNGRGIKEEDKFAQPALGLLGMQERARLVGGQVDITGIDGKGTQVAVRVPLVHQVSSLQRPA